MMTFETLIITNFPVFNKHIIIGDSVYQSLLENVAGYLFGSILLAVGLWKWIPGLIKQVIGEGTLRTSDSETTIDEENQANSIKFQQELLNAIPVPVFYKNLEGIYLGCNSAFEAFLGMNSSEIIGKSVYEVAPKELADGYYEKDMELINNPGTQVYEFEIVNKTNYTKNVVFYKATFNDNNGKVCGLIGAILDITAQKKAEEEREKLIRKLQAALDKVKVLSGFLPICSSCKRIRDDKGYWIQIEGYIRDHSDAEFSHGICPECIEKFYPDLAE